MHRKALKVHRQFPHVDQHNLPFNRMNEEQRFRTWLVRRARMKKKALREIPYIAW